MSKQAKQNEPLVTHIYTADPSAHVFEGKIYIYPSHDLEHDGQSDDDGSQYRMEDYHVFSMDDIDAPVVDHGEVLHMKNVPWVSQQMWAPDAAYKNGKYYLFFPAKDKEGIFRIGVATSDKPAGPFTPEPNYIPGSYSIDPAIFVDDDGKAYLYFGGIWGGQLEKWQTGTFNPNAGPQDPKEIAIGPRVAVMNDDMLSFAEPPQEIQILDENGNPLLAGDEDKR
ncbi:MAG TPA: family 43 glycosylhydrolase, partial [Mobilitalea sp.]|nr:family 43 glycosylhydrolase [Mobilitalea sp.]